MRSRLLGAAAAGVAIAALAVPAANAGLITPATPPSTLACQWPMYGHDPGRSFAQPANCSSVTVESVPSLLPKWVFPTPDAVSASPTIVNGHLYVGDWAGNFYSFDTATGTVDWTFEVKNQSAVGFGRIVSSAAYVDVGGRQMVVFGGGSVLYALDVNADDAHRQVASVCIDPRAITTRCSAGGPQIEILSSPAIVQQNGATYVVVGMDVHNRADVGRTGIIKFALTSTSLTPVWKFDPQAVDGSAYSGSDLLTVGSGLGSTGCSGVWGSPAVDVVNDLVVFGTASCSNQADADMYGEHLWGVKLSTGQRLWSYGPHIGPDAPSGVVDDDFGASPNLLPPTLDHPNGLVGCGSKDGTYYAVDRLTGEPVWSSALGQPGHVQPSFAIGGMIGSTATGTVNGEPAVFAATAISTPNDKPFSNGPDTSVPSVTQDPGRMLSLHAISAVDGRILWRAPTSRQAYGAPTFVNGVNGVNGVVLVPSTFDFQIKAFDANTGLPLAARPLHGPPSSAPTAVGDSVYVGAGTSTEAGSPLAPLSGVYAFQVI